MMQRLYEMVHEIDAKGENLTKWEITFIAYLIDKDIQHFTEYQEAKIRQIYEERMP